MNGIDNKIREVVSGTSFEDFQYEDFDNPSDLIESLQQQINENEVIYYSTAIEYLANNDASLRDSINIALEYGYTLENISSEILATLLQQQELNEELSEITTEIEECFE